MKTVSRRYRVLPSESGPRVVEVNGSKFAPSDLLDCEDMRRFLKRLGLLRPAIPCSQWLSEFALIVSDEAPEDENNLRVFVSRHGKDLVWMPWSIKGIVGTRPLSHSFDLFRLIGTRPEYDFQDLTIQPRKRSIGFNAEIEMKHLVECSPGQLFATDEPILAALPAIEPRSQLHAEEGPATDLDAFDLIDLVPGLKCIEGFISGLQVDADCCWEGHAAIVLHRDEILRRIAHYVGPKAETWMSETEDPRTRTQEAYDTVVKHFFEECPDNDPQMAAYLEARKSPEGLKHFFAVTVPAFWAKGAAVDVLGLDEETDGGHPVRRPR